MHQDERGASLIEILLTISLIVMLTVLFIPSFIDFLGRVEAKQIKNQFKSDIYWALQYADVNQKLLTLTFQPLNHSYVIAYNRKLIIKREYSKQLKIENNYSNNQILFHQDGAISGAGTVKIFRDTKLFYSLYIQLFTGNIREETN